MLNRSVSDPPGGKDQGQALDTPFDSRATRLAAFPLVVAIACADYITGYEVRLAVLYLVPVAIATWTAGRAMGFAVTVTAVLLWLVSFASTNTNPTFAAFLWEGATTMISFVVVVELIARLGTALTRSDARFMRVLEELFDGVYVSDRDSGQVLYANRRFAAILGSDPVKMPSALVERRFATGPEPGAPLPKPAVAAFAVREVRDRETGRWYLLQVGPIPWFGYANVTLRMLTDITVQRESELQKQQQQEAAYRMSRLISLGEVAAMLTHEMNQPLTAITAYSNACLRLLQASTERDPTVVAGMEGCRDQAVRAGRIVNRMRDFIRRRPPAMRACVVDELIEEALQLARADIESAGISVEHRPLRDSLPIELDRVMIVQVLVNLVQNAIDAMKEVPPERRRLLLSTRPTGDGGVAVTVGDSGAGVPEAIANRLFEPFCTTKENGLGLGLAICRNVVEAHSGRLWHRRGSDHGSEFHLELPRMQP